MARWAFGFALAAAAGTATVLGGHVLTADVDIPLDTPGGGVNELTMGLTAVGSVEADLGGIFGVQTIDINSSDSDSSTTSGNLRCDLLLDIDPVTLDATAQEISFKRSRIELDSDPSFTLDLGTIVVVIFPVSVGTVQVDTHNLVGTAATPVPPGPVTGTDFPQAPHAFELYEGTITGEASGLAADYIDPIDINLATTPLIGPLGTGNGTATVSLLSQNGLEVSYTVQITTPVDFNSLVLEDPVNVTVSAIGTVQATGVVTVTLPDPDFDGDGITDSLDPDDDNDDIPDAFEEANGLDPKNAADRDLNPDADQSTNYGEYRADTDPHDRLSDLVAAVEMVGGIPRISFPSSVARTYLIQYQDTGDSGAWKLLAGNIAGTGAPVAIDDPAAAGSRIYRLVVLPSP